MKRRDFCKIGGLAGILAAWPFSPGAAWPSPPDAAGAGLSGTAVKVIGVGGAGGRAVDCMIRKGMTGVEFIATDTDARALERAAAQRKLCLGRTGRSAAARPEAGFAAAMEARGRIAEALRGAQMAFIVAGLGGGTGGGAAPAVAEVAREMGVLTVSVAAWPFGWEGLKRKRAGNGAFARWLERADSLIEIVPDYVLYERLHGGASIEMGEAFAGFDEAISDAVGGIVGIFDDTLPKCITIDFECLREAMRGAGLTTMGSGAATGPGRARRAVKDAISASKTGLSSHGARRALFNVTASRSLSLMEFREVADAVRVRTGPDAYITGGLAFDDSLGDTLRVTFLAPLGGTGAVYREP
jgi:cell division protein FtsZ